jgi:hypothetical protein
MHESLPSPLRQCVAEQAEKMGLPRPDDYILLLIRLEKQRQDLENLLKP